MVNLDPAPSSQLLTSEKASWRLTMPFSMLHSILVLKSIYSDTRLHSVRLMAAEEQSVS